MPFDTPDLPQGGFAQDPGGPPASIDEVFRASFRAQVDTANIRSRATVLDEEYDKRIDQVEKATGVRLFHPRRDWPTDGDFAEATDQERQWWWPSYARADESAAYAVAENRFHRELDKLRGQYPDKAAALGTGTVWDAAHERVRRAEAVSEDATRRSPLTASVPLLGDLNPVGMAGSLAGFLHTGRTGSVGEFLAGINFENVALSVLGPEGSAAKGILWNASRQAAAGAVQQAVVEPWVQDWRREAGLDYGLRQAVGNVAMSGVFGGVLDATGRTVARTATGRPLAGAPSDAPATSGAAMTETPAKSPANDVSPPLSEPAAVTPRPAPSEVGEALEGAARRLPDEHVVRRAAEGDPAATLALAEKLAPHADDPPAVRGALDQFRLETLQEASVADALAEANGLDAAAVRLMADLDMRLEKAVAHVADPAASPPPATGPVVAMARFAPDAPGAAMPEGAIAPEVRTALRDGDLSPIQAASLIREHPGLAAELPPTTDAARTVHALAQLSDAGFARVADGGAPPELAALVGEAAPPGRHADLIERLVAANPRDVADARAMLADMLHRPTDVEAAHAILGVDAPDAARATDGATTVRTRAPEFEEPHGEGAKLQVESLKGLEERAAGIEDVRLALRDWFRSKRPAAVEPVKAGRREATPRFDLVGADEYPGLTALLSRMRQNGLMSVRPHDEAVPLDAIRALEPPTDQQAARIERYRQEPPPREVNISPETGLLLYRDGSVYYLADGHHRVAAARLRGDATIDARVRDIVTREEASSFRLRDGGSLAGTAYAPEFMARETAIGAELAAAVEKTLPRGVALELADRLRVGAYELDGFFDRRNNILAVALDSADPAFTFNHERIHALKAHGLFTDAEWGLLVAEAGKSGMRREMGRDALEHYRKQLTPAMVKQQLAAKGITAAADVPWAELEPMLRQAKLIEGDNLRASLERRGLWDETRLQAMIDEEAVAFLAERWRAGETVPKSVAGIMERIQAFLERIRHVLAGHGFQTLDDIFRRIDTGEVANRSTPATELRAAVDAATGDADAGALVASCKLF